MPRFYLDLRSHRDAAADGQTPFTPAIAVVYQVDEGIRLMQAEGAASIFARHEACAAASRAGLQALGFELFADERFASRTVTAAKLPEGHDWKAFNGAIKAHGVVLAGGQGKLSGKIFRLGHLGSVTVEEILGAIAVLEIGQPGAGSPDHARRRGRSGVRGGRRRARPRRARDRDERSRRPGVRILVAEPIAPGGRRAPPRAITTSTSGRA